MTTTPKAKAKTPRKPKASTTVTDAPTTIKPARASAKPTAAPGAIPVGGTDTQVQARATGLALSPAEAYSLTPADEPQPAIEFTGEAPAIAEVPKTPVQDAFGSAADQKATPPPAKRQAAVNLHFAHRITRLKMTLHNVEPLTSSGHSPLTRCTFGAVYSATPGEEDKVYGDATPYGSLSYNVRSELATALEVGAAYYIDIQKVPS